MLLRCLMSAIMPLCLRAMLRYAAHMYVCGAPPRDNVFHDSSHAAVALRVTLAAFPLLMLTIVCLITLAMLLFAIFAPHTMPPCAAAHCRYALHSAAPLKC